MRHKHFFKHQKEISTPDLLVFRCSHDGCMQLNISPRHVWKAVMLGQAAMTTKEIPIPGTGLFGSHNPFQSLFGR